MRNRPVQHRADHACTLRPGRVYRAVVIVCGETSLEELEDTLVDAGFDRHSLLMAAPTDWAKVCPRDWPGEPELEDLAVNECLVRIMGELESPGPVPFPRDALLPGGATFTFVQAWEYAPPLEQAGGQAPAPAPRGAVDGGGGIGIGTILLGGAAMLGAAWFFSQRSEKRLQRDQARMLALIEKEEAAEEDERTIALLEEAQEREEARELAGQSFALERSRLERARLERALAVSPTRREDLLALLEEA